MKIAGRSYWLWRAVDQHGVVLEEILQSKRDKRAAKRLLIKLMKRWGFVPKRIITDKLGSYGAAKREVAPGLDHWSHKGLNNRAENSHLPFRKGDRVMQGFRLPGGLQRFVSMQSATRNRFSRRGNPRHMPLDQRPECNLQTRRVNVTTPIFSVCIDTA